MSVQLGVADGPIPSSYSSSWAVNKLGGFPDWLLEGCVVPTCSACHRNMYLVLQIYCPLKSSPYHRVLYIFTCINRPCWNKAHSWKVLRSQLLDSIVDSDDISAHVENKMADKGCSTDLASSSLVKEQWCKRADDWGEGADDWGEGADDWGEGADDWGEGADDWGEVTDHKGDDNTKCLGDGDTGDLVKDGPQDVIMEENNTIDSVKETLDSCVIDTKVSKIEQHECVTDDLNCQTAPIHHFRDVHIREFEETPTESRATDNFRHVHIHVFEETPIQNTSDNFREVHIHEFEETPTQNTKSDDFREMHIHDFEETPILNTSDNFRQVHIHEFEETSKQNTSDNFSHVHIHEFEETPIQGTKSEHFREVHIHEFEETPIQNTSDNFSHVHIHEFEETPIQGTKSEHFREVHVHEFEETPIQNTSDNFKHMNIDEFEETPVQNASHNFRHVNIHEFEESTPLNNSDNFRHMNIHEFEESTSENTSDNFRHMNIHEFEESTPENTSDNYRHVNIHELEESIPQNTSDNFKQMNIHKLEKSTSENTTTDVTLENLPPSEELVKNMFNIRANSSDQSKSTQQSSKESDWLVSYFLCVIDEPANEEVDGHVKKLLKAYVQETGEDMDFIDDEYVPDHKSSFDRRRGRSDASGEKYEKTEVKHGDRCFHHFLKRLSIYPQQLVRYDLHGTPLLVSQNTADQFKVPPCASCGGPMIFELQLVPPLISLLRLPHFTDSVTEFGTVLVYTCENSCWSDEVKVREEVTIVQPDPDQDLFRV